tara:strand:- start:56712 stop:57995 length:1284 start_codon:yes stop_codon:yes gene_type:complete
MEVAFFSTDDFEGVIKAGKSFVVTNGFHHIAEKDLQDIAHEIARDNPRPVEKKSTCEIQQPHTVVTVDSLLASPAKERVFIVDRLFPSDIAGILAAPGGLSKSFLLLILGVCVALARPFLGFAVPRSRSVLFCSAEDDIDEVQRRVHAIREAARLAGEKLDESLFHRIGVIDMVGDTEQIVLMEGNNPIINTKAVDRIVQAANSLPDIGLVIIDPAARFRSGSEIDTPSATVFVKALEVIRKKTGASVIVAHHARKGGTGDTADDIRGASALVDAARWAATLAHLPEKKARKDYGFDEVERKSLIRFRVVKANYSAPISDVWLKRSEGGALHLTDAPTPLRFSQKEIKENADYQRFTEGVCGLLREQGPMTKRALRAYYGADKTLGCGRHKGERFIQRGLREKTIEIDNEGRLIAPKKTACYGGLMG